ncbi:MAG TPA: ABC transporter ATP-binding protein [Caldilineaceae bacterium]|nr:ABC transporter ATP-binding protein [Caldilineaceae bacterium]
MITVDLLTKRFGSFVAVEDLSFTVAPHQALALWGPNGAGKTTVLKCMLGLLRYQGRIAINGVDLAVAGKAARRLLGYVPQELAFYDDLSVGETAHFFARLRRVKPANAIGALEQVDLMDHFDKPVRALSGGMKQRLALALALLDDPPVLVLDEPTSNLDAESRGQLLRLLRQVKAQGKTIVFTSHRLDEVEALADQALVMERGRARCSCPAGELATRLGLTTQIKLHVPAGLMDTAVVALLESGYQARRNGAGVLVQVAPGARAGPIHALSRANIHVTDFETE